MTRSVRSKMRSAPSTCYSATESKSSSATRRALTACAIRVFRSGRVAAWERSRRRRVRARCGRCPIPCAKRGSMDPHAAQLHLIAFRAVCSEITDHYATARLLHTREVAGSNPAALIVVRHGGREVRASTWNAADSCVAAASLPMQERRGGRTRASGRQDLVRSEGPAPELRDVRFHAPRRSAPLVRGLTAAVLGLESELQGEARCTLLRLRPAGA